MKLFSRRKPRIVSAVVLPKRMVFFRALSLMLPPDFRKIGAGADFVKYYGKVSGITMTAMKLPFAPPLRTVTGEDICQAFFPVDPFAGLPAVEHGFLRHSPTLRATVKPVGIYYNVLYLVQVRKVVYLLYFWCIREEDFPTVDAVIASVQIVY